MFKFFKNKKNKEDNNMTLDEKEIEKAKKDIAEKGSDTQTKKDREDESVGEQEKKSGNENSQNAKDRIDESEGTKKADEKRDSKEDSIKRLESKLDRLVEVIDKLFSDDTDEEDGKALEKAKDTYGLKGGAFNADDKEDKGMSPKDAAAILRKLKG